MQKDCVASIKKVFIKMAIINGRGRVGIRRPSTALSLPVLSSGLSLYLDAGNALSYPGTGTAWSDISGNGNNGTLVNGPGYNSGNFGAIVFDGANDYVDLGVRPAINNATVFTLSVWFRTTSTAEQMIFSTTATNALSGWHIEIWNSRLLMQRYPGGAYTYASTALVTNVWYNFVLSYNSGTVVYYINGVQSGTATGTFTPSAQSINIGRWDYTTSKLYFSGKIPNVSFYGRVLSVSEILQNYNALKSRYQQMIVTDGLKMHLDAGQPTSYSGSGTLWTDLSGNGCSGALVNGPTYESANEGSIVFDGVNDYVKPANSQSLQLTSFTICGWIKLNVIGANQYIVDTSSNLGFGYGYSFRVKSDNKIRFWAYDANSALDTPSTVSANTWYNIVVSYNGVTKAQSIYINGVLAANNSHSTTFNVSNMSYLQIGGSQTLGGYLNGRISNMNMYNRVLSSTEITDNYNALKYRYVL